MTEKLNNIKQEAIAAIEAATTVRDMEDIRVSLLGKKGKLTELLKGMGTLSSDQRPVIGQLVNDTRSFIEEKMTKANAAINDKLKNVQLAVETIDVTIPGRRDLPLGHKHPMTMVMDEIKDIFIGMGYEIAEGPDIETDYYNFEALNMDENHPAKDESDTFYVGNGYVLRTATSPAQAREMEKRKPPIKVIVPGTVYRADEVDATHSPVFHQVEGLVVDENITMGDLKGALNVFARKLLGQDTKVRFRPHYFPFTEPSAEMDVSCFACGGSGCRVCNQSGWIELLGCGMVHPRVLEMSGIDPLKYSGFAFGMGLERLAMTRFGITDMRLLYENDVRFLKQF
ncbi:MAG: phenylalanine--tRNA ligase subunit alpha [Clostridiales bacterium]|nr:phenylalanine--tRNA ligase subunit alpha [Clostridiales bacterium]